MDRNCLRYLLIGFLLGLNFNEPCQAQTFGIGDSHLIKATAFDRDTKTIYAIWADSIRAFLAPDYKQSRFMPLRSPHRSFMDSYQALCLDSTLYFVHKKGGILYQLQGDTLRRIDHSFDHKMQANSTIFTRNDTIFRYGGYGFWSTRNFFTFFSPGSGEWEILSPSLKTKEVPRGAFMVQVAQDGNRAWIFSGNALDPVDPLKNQPNREAWLFNFDTRIWENLGTIEMDFHRHIRLVHLGNRILYNMPGTNQQVLADPGQNRLIYYPIKPRFKHIVGNITGLYEYGSFYHEGIFYLLRGAKEDVDKAVSSELYYQIVTEADFLGEPIREEPLYSKEGTPWKLLGSFGGVALLLAFLLIGFRKYSQANKILVGENSCRYRGKQLDLDPRSLAVLNLLIRSDGEVSSLKILDLVEVPSLSEAHNIKVKNQLIDALNFRLRNLLNIDEDLIEASRSEEDKRIKVYRINSAYFKAR